jgi:biotin carboxylase
METKRILLLGAGDLMSRSILKLQNANYKVFVVDKNPNSVGFKIADGYKAIDIIDEKRITKYAEEINAQCIIAANDAGVLAAALASKELGLKNISVQTALNATDKGLMREVWQIDNLPQPDFIICNEPQRLKDCVIQFGLPCVLKPCLNWGSKGVSLIMNIEDIDLGVLFALQNNRNNRFIIERYIDGTELTIEGLVINGNAKILAYSDKEHQQHDRYKVAMSLNYPAQINSNIFIKLQEIVLRAANVLGIMDGAFHCECMIREEDIFLVEMAARPGGGHIFSEIVEAVSGINMPVFLAKIFLNEQITLPEIITFEGACYRFFNPPKGKFISIENLDIAKQSGGVIDMGFKMAKGTIVNAISDDAARPGYIVTKGVDRNTALNNAINAINRLKFNMT